MIRHGLHYLVEDLEDRRSPAFRRFALMGMIAERVRRQAHAEGIPLPHDWWRR